MTLDHDTANHRELIRAQKIRRGTIFAADGSVIARSTRDDEGVYHRDYPQGKRFGHPVGYSYASIGQSELERYRNDELTGAKDAITTTFDQLVGKAQEGDDVRTSLDPKAQQIALDQIAAVGRSGAAVALDPRTGAVKVMASTPDLRPQHDRRQGPAQARQQRRRATRRWSTARCSSAPRRARRSRSSPRPRRSTAGSFSPASTVDGDSGAKISAVPLANDFDQIFGQVDLTTALAKSVNTAFAKSARSSARRP